MRKVMQLNAEFARNIWLEMSVQRLIIAPVLLVLVSAVIATFFSEERTVTIIHFTSLAIFALFGVIWGLKNAADSVIDEYNDKTWDWQRMSIIGPWKLAWGKLFGSTIYNWYIAGLCLAFYFFTAFAVDNTGQQLKIGFMAVLGMITIHSLMILLSLLMLRRGDGRTKIRSSRIFILGIILVFVSYRPFSSGLYLTSNLFNISWYGIIDDPTNVALLSGIFYCGWAVAGLYRSMRAELQFTDKPVWWVAFLVSSFFFQYGYVAVSENIGFSGGMAMTMGSMFMQTLVLTYVLALIEPKDIINFRLLSRTFSSKDFDTFFRNIPLWLTTLPIAFLFGALAVLFLVANGEPMPAFSALSGFEITAKAPFVLIAIFGFVLRDLGILLLLHFSNRARRASGAMLIYLVVLYVLLPLLTYKMGFGAIFYPDPKVNSLLMIFFPLAEAAVVMYFLWDRWRNMYSSIRG